MLKYFSDFLLMVIGTILVIALSGIFGFTKPMLYISFFGLLFCFIFFSGILFDPELRSIGYEAETIYHIILFMLGSFAYIRVFAATRRHGS